MKIYIIGFMGTGKSFLGKALADRLEIPFFDFDEMIEKKENRSIETIFRVESELYFRKLESQQLLNWKGKGIVATGGGIVELAENREILSKENCISVWLNPTWDVLSKRLEYSSKRPLFNKLTLEELQVLYKKRIQFYQECADIVINDPDLDRLLSSIKIYLKLKD